jgi:hypothetical protein
VAEHAVSVVRATSLETPVLITSWLVPAVDVVMPGFAKVNPVPPGRVHVPVQPLVQAAGVVPARVPDVASLNVVLR